MIKYFRANVEDARRIAIVEADDADDIYSAMVSINEELTTDQLPADFADWKKYTAFAITHATVTVMSRDGG